MRFRILGTNGMRSAGWFPARITGALLGLGLTMMLGSAWAGPDDFVLIRNARNPTTSLSRPEAKDMAIGKKKLWPHGGVVTMVLTPAGSPALAWFASTICGVNESSLVSKIKQEVFKGELRKPTIATSETDVLLAVAADEGALGMVRAEAAKSLPATVAIVARR